MEKNLFKASIIKDTSTATISYGMPSLRARKIKKVEAPKETPAQIAERVERSAYEKGYQAGEDAGFKMGQQKADLLVQRFEALTGELAKIKDNAVSELAPQVFDLAFKLAGRIIREEIKQKPALLVEMVKEAIRKLERIGPVTIKLNPAMFNLFGKQKAQLTQVHPEIIFEVDPAVPVAGAIVVGESDEVVTDIEEQLKNLEEDMRETLGTG